MKVPDASVLAALLFGEPRGEEAAAVLGGGPFAAPTLLPYELASVCLKKVKAHPRDAASFLAALELLGPLSVRLVQVPAAVTVELARRKRITSYDAAYLWLALELVYHATGRPSTPRTA